MSTSTAAASPDLLTALGAAMAIFLCSAGSAVASAQGGLFALHTSSSTHFFWSFAPIIIGGVLAIYGIIVAIILSGKLSSAGNESTMTEQEGYKNLSSGLAVGLACLSSGFGMAKFLSSYMEKNRGTVKPSTAAADSFPQHNSSDAQPLLDQQAGLMTGEAFPVTWKFLMVLCYLEAIGLYGLIVALILAN